MERERNEQLAGWLATAYNVERFFPVEQIYTDRDLNSEWVGAYDWIQDEEKISEVKIAIRTSVNGWLRIATPDEVIKTLLPIKQNPKLRSFLLKVRECVHQKFRYYFDSEFKGLPTAFARPLPFFSVSHKAGAIIELNKPIVKKYGHTTMEIKGTVLYSHDIKTIFALLLVMRKKQCRAIDQDFLYFRTTRKEIAETMMITNPSSQSVRDGIMNSLQRLRGSVITWKKDDEIRTIGGIVGRVRVIKEDKPILNLNGSRLDNSQIGIYMDKTFIDMSREGYTSLDPEILFQLPDRVVPVYFFLQAQKSFNTYGKYGEVDIFKFYEYAGLSGITEKPASSVRFDLSRTLREAEKYGIIKAFEIKNDRVMIQKNKPTTTD